MTDFSVSNLRDSMYSVFAHMDTLRVTARYCEQTDSIRAWRQRQMHVAYDLGPGLWRCQSWRSWWQAPDLWRNECSPFGQPDDIASGLLVQGAQWHSYHTPYPVVQSASGTVHTGHVPLLSGIGGASARDNARAWEWIDPSWLAQWPWQFSLETLDSGQAVWHGILRGPVWSAPSFLHQLFQIGDLFECWIEQDSGLPQRLTARSDEGLLWELAVVERQVNLPLSPSPFNLPRA